MDYKQYVAKDDKINGVSAEEISQMLTVPRREMGDFALPCFTLQKLCGKVLPRCGSLRILNRIPDDVIENVFRRAFGLPQQQWLCYVHLTFILLLSKKS
ncbi:MAG: hypothetical protein V8Q57_04460 [Blautia sp.]